MFFQKYADIILKEQDVSSFSHFCLLYMIIYDMKRIKAGKGGFFLFFKPLILIPFSVSLIVVLNRRL